MSAQLKLDLGTAEGREAYAQLIRAENLEKAMKRRAIVVADGDTEFCLGPFPTQDAADQWIAIDSSLHPKRKYKSMLFIWS